MSKAMSIAKKVQKACEGTAAFTLRYGYAITYNKETRYFPIGRCKFEKRNSNGRVTKAKYLYSDKSALEYSYSEAKGHTLTAKPMA